MALSLRRAAPVLADGFEALAAARALTATFNDATLQASGLLAIRVPRSSGGADVSARILTKVLLTLATADPALAQRYRAHTLTVESLRACDGPFDDVLSGRWPTDHPPTRPGPLAPLLNAAIDLGIAKRILTEATRTWSELAPWLPAPVPERLTELTTALRTAEALLDTAASTIDNGRPVTAISTAISQAHTAITNTTIKLGLPS
ncbi:hypothetical protein GCM10009555_071740 [Acrocarpospora macrocephala]|uniref:Uncharacterized protein n=1 Tax=Acrocarpospora macrocephala TaxID=150177 RepID=A0A5M3WJX3_9ACTN|nr:hypothetical protein [Acrocarpospora macrocephala]GES08680.1 hypothetical protein Amac_022760 [Acrocarpospora macrocephala]